ncbi:baseplate J/gp47 family protein [Nodularia sp. NIES-3585]|uniref:baseplate J/gp47 family protein n=1 Tax=Nodularia sp. NIES-3585 TaxID=1973477 RepID=UPI000B5CFFCF|nr:baseplate J/gp47 family protein [Nodularia sp. NIES-3585]GAX37254.1 hypothetical protein NIES3585_32970 [Nodularia sp. NIES-3585]
MPSKPPKIDQRSYAEIVKQTETLVQEFTDWKPSSDEKKDVGMALIRIFGRMISLVSDRLNQVPEKNFLAFLDLIGGQLKPPQAAKVPLTFYLAEGSPVDGFIPAYTQVSAPPAEGSDAEIVFETDQDLVVTTTQLQAVFLREPIQDSYSDCTLAATGQKDTAFFAFIGDRQIPHSLYITCPEILSLLELKEFKLIFTADNASQFPSLPLNWSYWNGSEWQEIPTSSTNYQGDQATITFTNLPIPTIAEIQGKAAKWLQAKLTNISSITASLPEITNIQGSININQSDLIPDICLYNSTPLDLSKDFYPFGEQPERNDTFYIALHDGFIKQNTIITLNIELSHKPTNINNLNVIWEIGNGQVWQEIADKNNQLRWIESSSAIQFTEQDTIEAKLKFPTQEDFPVPSTVNGETRYWIRARIIQGHYGQPSKQITNYVIYNEVATVNSVTSNTRINIVGNASDFFSKNDVIRLVYLENTVEKREEYEINSVAGSTLTVKTAVSTNARANGTKILRRNIISETSPQTYDPPLIKALKLTYEFNLTEDAIYLAENDFTYSEPESLSRQSFQPFTPTIDQEPTLYLGFDKSFDNKTVTLYAQVESPSPDELSTDITTETILIEAANPGEPIIKVADVTGWEKGDRLKIPNPINPKEYDKYTITDISDKQVIIHPFLQHSYEENTPVIHPQQPQLVWEYSSPLGWQPLGVNDQTQAFSQPGLIQFIAPADFNQGENFGKQLYWLRVRWLAGNFRVKPRLRRLLTNTIWAIQAISLKKEVLGSSNYESNQVFIANNIPILMGQQLEVEEGQIPNQLESERIKVIRDDLGEIEEVWTLWQEVPDFYGSRESDRHYILDRQTGEIRFGNGQTGMIPPRGRNNIRLTFYRTGGGEQGNVTSQTISQLKTTVPYIDQVINLEAAAGGSPQESLDRLKERVPKQLRHRDRAVTIDDIADLAYAASTDVARVKVVTPDLLTPNFSALNENFWLDPNNPDVSFNDERENTIFADINRRAGQVKLIILPQSSDRQPVPSLALLKQVETYIRSRCHATMDLVVTAPKWQEVTVTATISPISLEAADVVRNKVRQYLEAFLHPLTGGRGEGWQFGRSPEKSDFYAIIQSISGVDYVDSLEILPATELNLSSLSADTLIYSGNHTINIK